MSAKQYLRGHEIYYDDEKKAWIYTENGERVYDNECIECVKCDKPPIDDVDFCLYALHDCDFINAACCGHGVKPGYIKLKDGRVFREEESDMNELYGI